MGCRSAGFVLIVSTVPGAVCENGRLAALLLGLESPHILQYAAGFSPRAPCIPPVLTHRPWQIPWRLAALLLGLESPHILQYAAGFSPRAPCIPPVLTHRPWQIPWRLAALLFGLAARCGCPPDTRLTARDLTYFSMLWDHCTRAAGGNATGAEVLSPGGGFRVRDRRGTGGRRSGGSRPGLSRACCVKSPNPSSGSLP